MGWFSKASMECEKRGYEVVDFKSEDGTVYLKKDGVIIPITAEEIDRWVNEDKFNSLINKKCI